MGDPDDDELPPDLVLLLTPPSDIYRRVEPAEFIAFVAAVIRVVDAHFGRQPSDGCIEVYVACGLLPGGKVVVEVQTLPSDAVGGLVEAVMSLPVPEIVQGPVAFTRRNVFGNRSSPPGRFGLPFGQYARAAGMTLLDDALMSAASGRAPRKSIWSRLSGFLAGTASPRRTIAEQDIISQLASEIGVPVIACNGRVVIRQ